MFIFSSLHVFKIGSFNPLMLEIPCSAQRNFFLNHPSYSKVCADKDESIVQSLKIFRFITNFVT